MNQPQLTRKYYRLSVGGMWVGSILIVGGVISMVAKASAVEWVLFILGLLCGMISVACAVRFRKREDAAARTVSEEPGAGARR